VLASTDEFCTPAGALLKVGGGDPSFYSDGAFSVDVPGGQVDRRLARVFPAVRVDTLWMPS
jgi:hypothetical protein